MEFPSKDPQVYDPLAFVKLKIQCLSTPNAMFLIWVCFRSCKDVLAFCVIITADCLIYVLRTDMGQFDATKGKQALEIRSSLSERRALTDPILPGDSADLAHAHSRQWAKAHGEFSTIDLKHFFICYLCLENRFCLWQLRTGGSVRFLQMVKKCSAYTGRNLVKGQQSVEWETHPVTATVPLLVFAPTMEKSFALTVVNLAFTVSEGDPVPLNIVPTC